MWFGSAKVAKISLECEGSVEDSPTLYVTAEVAIDLRFSVASAFLELKLTNSLGLICNMPNQGKQYKGPLSVLVGTFRIFSILVGTKKFCLIGITN